MFTDAALAKKKAESLVWSEWCKTARKRPTKAELAQCSEITGRLNDEDYQWTLYATYFWARLMERVRLKYWRDPENRNNLQLTGAVCGTLMLSAVAMLPDDSDLIDFDENWDDIFGSSVSTSQAQQFEKQVLADLNYNLELSTWTMAMDQVEEVAFETQEVDQLLVQIYRLEEEFAQARRDGTRRDLNNLARNSRQIKRSCAKFQGKLDVLKEVSSSFSSALHPISMYREILGPDLQLSLARLSINERDQLRIDDLPSTHNTS